MLALRIIEDLYCKKVFKTMCMKKKINYVTLGLSLLLLFSACKKDKGNYTYTDPNTITITTDMANVNPAVVVSNDSIIVQQDDSLKVAIIVSQTQPGHEVSYLWMITQAAASSSNPAQY